MARKHVPHLAEPPDAAGPDAASAADDRGELAAGLRRLPRVECFGFGRLDGHQFTPLPGVPKPYAITVSGADYWGTADW